MMSNHGESPLSAGPLTESTFGRALYRLRRRKSLTGHALAERAGMSQAKISRLENGAPAAPVDVHRLAEALELTDDEERRLVELADQAHDRLTDWRSAQPNVASRQRFVGDLEASTAEFRVFQPAVVVGLLQTSDYARSVMTSFATELGATKNAESTSDVASAIAARMDRQRILDDPGKHFHIVMTESVLQNRVCRPTQMAAQMERLREVRAKPNVTLGIVPADSDLIIAPYHGFELMDDRYVFLDLFNTSLLSGGRGTVKSYRQVFDVLERSATTLTEPILQRYQRHYAKLSIEEIAG
jgi:transcriptional regulator with XRE-family HTH domain